MLKILFSSKGRVNRLQNIGYEFLAFVLMMLTGIILAFFIFGIKYLTEGKEFSELSGIEIFILFIPSIIACYSNIIIKIKRLHDINLSGWWLPVFIFLAIPYFVLYFLPGTRYKNRFDDDFMPQEKEQNNTSLSKAVYNHSKDIVNEIKPAINEYKEKHSTTKNENKITDISESKIYEDIMLEIEQDNKVKSTWAKALSQSDGNKAKAESLYINFRVEELKKELFGDSVSNHLNSDIEKKVEIRKDSSSKKIVFLIILISIILSACITIFLLIYYSFNKDNSNTINSSIQSDNNPIENSKVAKNENVSNIINSKSDNINTNNTKEEPIINKWKYKDWEVENIDNNYIKAFTVGKNRADIFTIIKKKDDCNPSFLYTTTHLFDKSIIVNENDILKMDIKVDNELFNSDTPIYEIYNLGFVRQLMSKPYPLYESFLDKLKKGNTIQTTVYSPILKNIDITPKEEYSLNGFTKAFNILNEACRDISVLDKYKDIDKNISSK
ncbi:DUF805 domain-containing protein [Aliarcobacter cryaerophilus]|uniref:DUF805 domain-containing protein n=1 Tax=Aliarcobacter cryaerophilus TaxID=28198 RepID=UPI0021B68C80|nr:DUF805 domain-containing protein [Aliarcobacter cryaerophilus]MCT7485491.1 DUF805 domain-containing protein [Aliarcobacter cryaerophilus]MCT7491422.1 DUF805 domain-containing protein [Aliarcobacter cryaerophilus]